MNGAQLKNSILQWAIQGKLVPQNPKDEPASKLLERIAASRNENALSPSKGAKSKKSTPTSRIYRENGVWYEQVGNAAPKDISDDIPFEIPENWAWCRLGNIVEINGGFAFKSENYVDQGKGVRVVRISDFNEFGFVNKRPVYHPFDSSLTAFRLAEKDILMCMTGGTVGKSMYVRTLSEEMVVNQRVADIKTFAELDSEYIYQIICSSYIQDIILHSKNSTNDNISMELIKGFLIPTPPIAEQKRIVAKLEQVLPLADEYGAAQEQLDKLNKELPEALKKSILQQAIQGKLVPQNPKDEPAQILLERIAASRNESSLSLPKGTSSTSLRGAKATKQSKNPPSRIYCENGTWYEQIGNAEPKDISDDIPFEIPKNWTWCRLNSICDYLHRGKSPSYSDKKILPIMAQKCNQWDRIYTEKCLFADPKTIDRYLPEHFLQLGDVLINSTGGGTVGRTGYVDEYVFSEYDKFVADSHVTVVRSNKNICSKYVYYFLITPLIQTGIEERCSGSTNQIELGTETIKNYLTPLPPLAEQKRIVAKLEQLVKVL